MYEVELKLRVDHDAVRARLSELGATHTTTVRQRDTYYNAPHREFGETDEAIRIRNVEIIDADFPTESETDAVLTYKGPLIDAGSKTREEYESPVEAEAMADILAALGFSPLPTIEKEREQYQFEGYTITLDSVGDLGEFIEIERMADEDRIESVRDGAHEILQQLSLDPNEQITTSYLELYLESEL